MYGGKSYVWIKILVEASFARNANKFSQQSVVNSG
jgi:hypothetical protein